MVVVAVIFVVLAVALTDAPTGSTGGGQQPAQAPEKGNQQQQQAPDKAEDYLWVTGTKGTPFDCAVMDGDMNQRTVEGNVPRKIALKEMGIGATSENQCQKQGAEGVLTVTLVVGGDVQDQNSTSAEYGVVSVGYP